MVSFGERSFSLCTVLIGFVGLVAAVSPELEPESHKTFFGKDYPDDVRAKRDSDVHKFKFKHPYPAVQDSDDFHKDFVKDDNSDAGEWDSQMKYDSLRARVREQMKKVDEAQTRMDKAGDDVEEMKKAQSKAEKMSKIIEDAADTLNEASGRSEDKVKSLDDKIDSAMKRVEKEMDDLEECKKELEEAKKKLKKLLDEGLKGQKEPVAKMQVDEELTGDGDDELTEMEKKLPKLKSSVDRMKADLKKAQEQYKKEVQDIAETEKELDRAAQRLRNIRKGVDPDGGVYYTPDNNSASKRALLPAVIVASMALAGAFAV